MRIDTRLSRMLHALLHMARRKEPMTSEVIAQMLETNPVVVRRTMGGLREAGLVCSEKGHGGGWSIARDLSDINLLDVHRALAGPRIFALGNPSDNPLCAVERVVNAALDKSFAQAEALLAERLGQVRLSDLVEEFDRLYLETHPSSRRRRRTAPLRN
jgi:DNA-binding IscR family transcriptional regulator